MGKNLSTSRSDAARQVLADEKKRRRRSTAIQAGVVGVIVVAIVGGTVFALQNSGGDTEAGAPAAVNADGALVVGDPEAPVRLQVVEDFQCPACKSFEASYGETLDEYAAGGDVAVEYRGI
ncbi:thioredoxin domain-containing protein, partial [Nocardioides sp.]|uniref:thioredoxin domain-containing protein n=1 Tax=Nocardioides sp. TaxID=35761 RepID=UPI002B27766A